MFKEGDIVELVRDCTNDSPTAKGSIGYVTENFKDSVGVKFPSDNEYWYIKNADLRLVKPLFPKHFKGYRYFEQ